MIYEKISQLSREKGKSIKEVEQSCGLGNGVIGKWRTMTPRVDKLKAVADFFGVTVDELLR